MSNDSFFTDIIPFADAKPIPLSVDDSELTINVVYYEWSESARRWLKTRDTDQEPDLSLPAGKFDGQIIELEF